MTMSRIYFGYAAILLATVSILTVTGCSTPKTPTAEGDTGAFRSGYVVRVYNVDFQTAYDAGQAFLSNEDTHMESSRAHSSSGLLVANTDTLKYIFRFKMFDNGLTEVRLKVHPTDYPRTLEKMDLYQTYLPAGAMR